MLTDVRYVDTIAVAEAAHQLPAVEQWHCNELTENVGRENAERVNCQTGKIRSKRYYPKR